MQLQLHTSLNTKRKLSICTQKHDELMKVFLFFFNMLFNGGFRTAIGSKHRSKINVLVTMSDNIFPQTNGCFVLVIAVYNHKFRFICVYHHSMSVTVIIQNTQFPKELISTCCENYRIIHKHQNMQPVQKPITSTPLLEHRYQCINKQIEQKNMMWATLVWRRL